jgi:endo-1,4-beta-D-glucanase Y
MVVRRRLLPIFVLTLLIAAGCKHSSWPLWNAYSARFVSPQGRVFDPAGDQSTTSESQAYAMFFALAANDRTRFDRVLNWTQANLAQGDLGNHLPACIWGKNQDGAWTALDANSASNADVWMAYTMLEAGRLWNAPQYASVGRHMLSRIAEKEVVDLPGFGAMLLPGASGFKHDQYWVLNPSYVPAFLFERLAAVDPAGPWREIAANVPRLIEQSARHGYAMDWVEYFPGDGFYPAVAQDAAPRPGKEMSGAGGGYDAIRVYLWAGMQDENSGARVRMLNAVSAMNGYLQTHDAPPAIVSGDGIPSTQDGPVGFSAAVLPYLRAFPGRSSLSAQQMIRMSLMRDESTGLYGKQLDNYDQDLALFARGFIDRRFRFGPAGELKVSWKN